MGYYTHYALTIAPDFEEESEEHQSLQKAFKDVMGYGDDCLDDLLSGQMEATKWYAHDENMLEISTKFPDLLFTLKGEGEEANDLWIKYYKKGKIQVANAEITFAVFDESKLKTLKESQ
jgi:hypothetical protein